MEKPNKIHSVPHLSACAWNTKRTHHGLSLEPYYLRIRDPEQEETRVYALSLVHAALHSHELQVTSRFVDRSHCWGVLVTVGISRKPQISLGSIPFLVWKLFDLFTIFHKSALFYLVQPVRVEAEIKCGMQMKAWKPCLVFEIWKNDRKPNSCVWWLIKAIKALNHLSIRALQQLL